MAEAAVDHRPNKFFCHQCSVEINPTLPDYTCPRCQSGFIEEMEISAEVLNEDLDGPGSGNEFDPAQHFAELWGRTFLESFRAHTDPDSSFGSQESGTSSGNSSSNTSSSSRPSGMARDRPRTQFFPHTFQLRRPVQATTDHHHHPHPSIEGIIQQILGGLAGGAVISTAGLPGMNLYGNPGDYAWGAGGLDAIITQLLNQLESSGAPPADKSEIDSLPTIQVSQEQIDKTAQCSVCMEDFKLNETVRQLVCQHCYHTNCIVPWLELHGTCPVCRKNLKGEDPNSGQGNSDGGPSTHMHFNNANSYDYSTQDEQD